MVRHTGKDGPGQRVYYRCSEYRNGCKTWAIVQDNRIVNMHKIRHNHGPTSNINSKRAELWAVEQAENLDTSPKEIWDTLKNLPDAIRLDMAPKKLIMRRITYRRQKVKKAKQSQESTKEKTDKSQESTKEKTDES